MKPFETRHLTTLARGVSALLVAGVALAGCSKPDQVGGPSLPDPGPDGAYTSPVPVVRTPYATRLIDIDIDPALRSCGLPQPKFHFDEATPRPQAMDDLRALAECLQRPPHDRSQVVLLGHADPRGGEEYNEELGEQRAAAVARALQSHGVAPERITTRSHGEEHAVGQTPAFSYGYDRRVDVVHVRTIAPR